MIIRSWTGTPQALQVFTGNQVDPSKVDAAYEELRDKTSIPSGFFWIDIERVAAHLRGDVSQVHALSEYLPKTAASLTFDYLARLLHLIPEVQRDSVTGFEFWFHCISEPVGMANLHVDNDPPLALGTGKIRVPLWGGILYLGPHDGIQGGGTMFNLEEPASAALLQKCMSRVPFPELSTLSSQWVTVPLFPGRMVFSEGRPPLLGHLFLQFPCEGGLPCTGGTVQNDDRPPGEHSAAPCVRWTIQPSPGARTKGSLISHVRWPSNAASRAIEIR